ncbi:hypothetical protein V2G26_018596 [Clonostachys chloroleuca]
MSTNQQASWETKAQTARDILENSIPKQWLVDPKLLQTAGTRNVTVAVEKRGLLTDDEIEMTNATTDGLLEKYRSGFWTAEAVIIAYLKRATIGHQLLNFATEFLAESAIITARNLDRHFRETGTLVGPLHGVPTSVKEHVAIGGARCNASFVSKIDNIVEEDALIVKLLKAAGAVIHVRTNQPQSIMHLDCNNNITGMTLNPLDERLSPGGSSGGEGAAIGFRCSVLGVGTDIGGSVRVPAAFCNAYGFKPTALRNPSLGLVGAMGGQEGIRGCVGPLARNLDDLMAFEKVIWNQKPWETDTVLVPLPWREVEVSPDTLTVGILFDDGLVRPHPPVTRAIVEAEKILRAAGIKTVRWEPHNHAESWEILRQFYFADGGERVRAVINESGEPVMPLTEFALTRGSNEPLTIHQSWELNMRREKLRREYHALMRERDVDVILCPSYAGVGAAQGTPTYWLYTAIWNALDQPAVCFPSNIVADKELDKTDAAYQPRSDVDKKEWEAYDPELFHGIPVSLQLVGKHHRDEELLRAAKIVEGALLS